MRIQSNLMPYIVCHFEADWKLNVYDNEVWHNIIDVFQSGMSKFLSGFLYLVQCLVPGAKHLFSHLFPPVFIKV